MEVTKLSVRNVNFTFTFSAYKINSFTSWFFKLTRSRFFKKINVHLIFLFCFNHLNINTEWWKRYRETSILRSVIRGTKTIRIIENFVK